MAAMETLTNEFQLEGERPWKHETEKENGPPPTPPSTAPHVEESCDWLLKNFDARQSAREEDRRSRPSRASTAIRDEKTSVG